MLGPYLIVGSVSTDIKTAVKNKVPLVRSLTLNWVTFCFKTSTKSIVQKVHKDYVPICMEVSKIQLLTIYPICRCCEFVSVVDARIKCVLQ